MTKEEQKVLVQTANKLAENLQGRVTFNSRGDSAYVSFGSDWLASRPIPWRTIRISNHQTTLERRAMLWKNIVVDEWFSLPIFVDEVLEAALPLRFPWRKAYRK